MNNTLTLSEYVNLVKEGGAFIIPSYQRGYVWGQEKPGLKKNSVLNIIDTLIDGFTDKKDVFLQGITVCEKGADIILVDGQQRTTFFYLFLKYLEYNEYLRMVYAVRKESDNFLKELDIEEILKLQLDEEEQFQDIYFFKKTLLTIHDKLNGYKKVEFLNYALEHVKFLYIPIPEEKATVIFSMMNGNKAQMKDQELVKSELLRTASLQDKNGLITEGENTIIRSRLAREWDSWLYWWNDKERQTYFHIESQLGWLLPLMNNSEKLTFDDFKKKNLEKATVRSAKTVFKKMRLFQKSIEDAYNDPITYNYIGAILNYRNDAERRFTFLRWFFDMAMTQGKDIAKEQLAKYFDWALLDINHADITSNRTDVLQTAMGDFLAGLEDDLLYQNKKHYEIGSRWLLRRNIQEDCLQESGKGRKFDFEIWRKRSLEHIYPKSKVKHEKEGVYLNHADEKIEDSAIKLYTLDRKDIKYTDPETEESFFATEHSIGNLVLLYRDDNSAFNADDFESKKRKFFENVGVSMFKSRHLIHTISIFSSSKWEGEDIARNKQKEINKFNEQFNIYLNNE